ncbi:MAG: alpha/beta fold hydrolase [Desulfobacterales bacterium]|nr:MAG: alpha/beta fold hydrolase [Desulfobacterales bacterium]
MMMPILRIRVLFLLCLGVLLGVSGCTTAGKSGRPPVLPSEEAWQKNLVAPVELKQALFQAELAFIPRNGRADIPVRIFGASGRRTPVIMSHGLQSHSGWFVQSAALLANQGHPVYSMDRRGSGLSQAKRGDLKDFKIMIEDIHSVADFIQKEHAKEQVYVLGHCFGAIPATAFACLYPQLVKGLILTTPAIYTKTEPSLYWKLRILLTPAGTGDFMVPNPLQTSMFTELKEYEAFIKSDSLSLKAASGDFYYEVHRARKYLHKNIQRLTMPVLMGIAAGDPICDNRRNLDFFKEIPAEDKTLIEYNDARHILEFSLRKR